MADFLDHMAFVCLAAAIIGFVLAGWCWLGGRIIDKFWDRDKFVEFLFGKVGDFEDED